MLSQSLYQTYQRFRTMRTNKITILPIVILMPHSACNCRCIMCDIWKGNKNLQQLREDDIRNLVKSLREFRTRQVVMSGGEALLNPQVFRFCEILKKEGIHITLLSAGLTLKKHAEQLLQLVNDVIVSLDGDEHLHDTIRNIPGAFSKLKEGVQHIRSVNPFYRISARTVIHKLNFRSWAAIVKSAKEIGVDQISFLPADITSGAFNRQVPWDQQRQQEVAVSKEELPELNMVINDLIQNHEKEFMEHFIAESPEKIKNIYKHYCAVNGVGDFPSKECNAPWVSAVVEADGTVRPCFFHSPVGNIREGSLKDVLNGNRAMEFRKTLDLEKNEICRRCVCHLNLSPWSNPVSRYD